MEVCKTEVVGVLINGQILAVFREMEYRDALSANNLYNGVRRNHKFDSACDEIDELKEKWGILVLQNELIQFVEY